MRQMSLERKIHLRGNDHNIVVPPLAGSSRRRFRREAAASLHHSLEVDIAAFYIGAEQFHAELVADVHAFKTDLQSSFDGRIEQTDPRSLVGCAGDDGIELFPDP